MLNVLWPIFIIISIIYAILSGNIENVNKSIFDSVDNAVKFSINLLGMTCLWSGLMEIAVNTNIIRFLNKVLKPIMKKLFPNLEPENKASKDITMNIIANILGLGNAATPLGLKAIEELQKENNHKETLSDNMIMLILLNTASLQIIPTTVLSLRNSLQSDNPTEIIFPVWVATICAALAGITITKILIKKGM